MFRICLRYKKLEFEVVYLEYLDIEPTAKKIGAKPTSTNPDGSPHYTVPIITDSSTGEVVSDSFEIAKYLDMAYPHAPRLFPSGTGALQGAFQTLLGTLTAPEFLYLMLPVSHSWLNPSSAEYFRRTREQTFGMKLEEFAPAGSDARKGYLDKMKAVFDKADGWLQASDGPFFLGNDISYADITIVAILRWAQRDLAEWEEVAAWHNGRWADLIDVFKQYE